MAFFKEELKKIRAFVFDVDGVLSRQEVSLSPEGELIRTSCAKDGYALMYSGKKGYILAIISGGGSPGLEERFKKLGIKDIYLRIENKVKALEELRFEAGRNHVYGGRYTRLQCDDACRTSGMSCRCL